MAGRAAAVMLPAMNRVALLAFGILCYAVFGVALVWAVLFLTGAGGSPLVDSGPAAAPAAAVLVDVALLGLFAVQHSVMARGFAKRAIARLVPSAAGRSTYVLAASLTLLLLFWQWRPLGAELWKASGVLGGLLTAAGWLGWLALVASTFMIDHLDLFGLRQPWQAFRRREYSEPRFQTRWFYRLVRHPLMTSFLVVFWAVPRMTAGHLLFSVAATGYVLVGTWFEERDLLSALPEYADYRRRVGRLLPRLSSRPGGAS